MEERLKVIRLIHLFLCAGIAFAIFILGNISSIEFIEILRTDVNSYIYLLIPIVAFIISNLLFKTNLKPVNKKLSISDNFGIYQTAHIMRMAILEGSCFLILFLKSEFAPIAMVILIYMIYLWPTEDKIKNDIESI